MPDQNGGFFRDTECVDGPRGDSESYLMHDVRSFVQAHFAGSLDGRQWAIAGFSEGGTCALTLALRHPESFGAFLDIGGDREPNAGSGQSARALTVRSLYGGRQSEWLAHEPLRLLRQHQWPSSQLAVFADGRGDRRHYRDGLVLAAAFERAGLPTQFAAFPGGHDFQMVHRALTSLLPLISDHVSLPKTHWDQVQNQPRSMSPEIRG